MLDHNSHQADHLSSTRTIVNASGSLCYDTDYTPFGQDLSHTNSCAQNYKFTGYERDSETGLDYAYNRYYNSRIGRFMSPDPAGLAAANFNSPQSLNRYAYVLNNPISAFDPSGLNCVWDDGSYDSSDDPGTGTQSQCEALGGTWQDQWVDGWTNLNIWQQQFLQMALLDVSVQLTNFACSTMVTSVLNNADSVAYQGPFSTSTFESNIENAQYLYGGTGAPNVPMTTKDDTISLYDSFFQMTEKEAGIELIGEGFHLLSNGTLRDIDSGPLESNGDLFLAGVTVLTEQETRKLQQTEAGHDVAAYVFHSVIRNSCQ